MVGISPQVLTETVYALAMAAAPDERFVPTEVHVVTTSIGARRLCDELLEQTHGAWWRLLRDYGLGPIAFDESHLAVVADAAGRPLSDIRTAEDNARVADTISERVRELTADPGSALHVSLAGGRKTMGYYAGYALSLFGRPQDRLSHVLVPAAFEALAGFYYPTPEARLLPTRDGSGALDAAAATVQLAQVPFVRLRTLLPPALLSAPSSFAAVVAAARLPPPQPQLRLHVATSQAVADDQVLALTPTQFALLAVLAHRAMAGKSPLPAPPRDAHDPGWAQSVLADLRAAVGLMHVDDAVAASIRRDCAGNKISPHLSRLRKLLRERLGAVRAALYFDDGGTHRHKRYRLPLPPESIEILRPEPGRKLAAQPAGAKRNDTAPDLGGPAPPGRT